MGSLGSNPGVSANSRNRMVGKKQIVLTELQIREAVSYISDCTCRLLLNGGLTRPAVSLVLKTSGPVKGMGIDTSAFRHKSRLDMWVRILYFTPNKGKINNLILFYCII